MSFKKHKPEEIIGKLREADRAGAGGIDRRGVSADRGQRADILSMAQGIWRSEDRPGAADEDLEKENGRLRRAISDLTLDKLILQEAARGNF